MESKKFRNIIEAYSSIYEAKEDPEMEEGEEKEEEEHKGKKKEKKEKEEEGDEEEMEEGFRTIPAGRQREAMMKRASNLTKQAMTPSKDYADIGDGGKGSPREKAGKINDALRDPKLRKEEFEGDLFDYLLEYLVAEGYADTNKAALAIMANMSEEWRQSIVEEVLDEDSRRMSNKQRTASVRQNIKAFGSNFTPPNNYDPDANRGQGEVVTRKQIEKKRRKQLRNPGGEN